MQVAAVEQVARTSGLAATVAEVLHTRALRQYYDGLRQYLAIRLGDVEQARAVLREVRALAAALTPEQLASGPGARAHLYRLAHGLAARELEKRSAPVSQRRLALPWRSSPPDAAPDYAGAVRQLRTELPPDEAEILELTRARELGIEEVAHVLEVSVAEAQRRLAEALAAAEAIAAFPPAVGDAQVDRPARGLREALVEAFSLQLGRDDDAAAEEAEPALLPNGAVMGGRYRIEEALGAGAFADVYRAADTEVPGHVVALKVMRRRSDTDAARSAALRELHLIASVFHPSVIHFKDHGWHQDRLWFVMPLYDGETLEARMARGPLTRVQARRIFEPLARALATMHSAGVRHQDIKPENIFLARVRGFGGDDVLPVLIDLGVAAREAETVIAGTPMYFAPEVAGQFAALGNAPSVTGKADVFSLALALRNALEPATQENVGGASIDEFIHRRATSVPASPRSRDLRFLGGSFRRWLALDPQQRPDADQLADELADLTRPEERRQRVAAILRWLLPTLFTAAAIFAGIVYILSRRADMEKRRAEKARTEAADLKAEMVVADARRRALEAGNEDLRQKYERGQLTREQMAGELATTEGQVRILQEGLATGERLRAEQLAALELARAEAARLAEELAGVKTQLAADSAKAAALFTDLEKARARGTELASDLEAAKARAKDLAIAADALRGELTAAQDRVRDLEKRVAALEAAPRAKTADPEGADGKSPSGSRRRSVAAAADGGASSAEPPAPATADGGAAPSAPSP